MAAPLQEVKSKREYYDIDAAGNYFSTYLLSLIVGCHLLIMAIVYAFELVIFTYGIFIINRGKQSLVI